MEVLSTWTLVSQDEKTVLTNFFQYRICLERAKRNLSFAKKRKKNSPYIEPK